MLPVVSIAEFKQLMLSVRMQALWSRGFPRDGNGQEPVVSFKGTEDGSGAWRACLVCSLETIHKEMGEGHMGNAAGCNSSEIRPNPTLLRSQSIAEIFVHI